MTTIALITTGTLRSTPPKRMNPISDPTSGASCASAGAGDTVATAKRASPTRRLFMVGAPFFTSTSGGGGAARSA